MADRNFESFQGKTFNIMVAISDQPFVKNYYPQKNLTFEINSYYLTLNVDIFEYNSARTLKQIFFVYRSNLLSSGRNGQVIFPNQRYKFETCGKS